MIKAIPTNSSETTSQTDEIEQGKGPSCGNKKEAV